MFEPADGVVCEKDGEHSAPDDSCNLFSEDPITYQSLSGERYSIDEGVNGQIYRRDEKLLVYS